MDRELLKTTLLVDTSTLGEPLADFRTGAFQFVLLWVIAIGSILFGVVVTGLSLVLLVLMLDRIQGPGDFLWLAVGVAAVVLGVATLRRTGKTSGVRAAVFAEGLVRVQGENVEVARWAEVDEVHRGLKKIGQTQGFTVRMPARLMLRCRDGRELEFNETLAGLPELRRLVEERTLPLLLPAVREAYDAGQPLRFGAVRVDGDGLHYFQKTLPWDRVGPAEASGGRLTVRPADGRGAVLQVPFVDVPNVHILLALLEHAQGHRG